MVTRILTTVLALLLATLVPGTVRSATGVPGPAAVPDEVIVKFKPGTSMNARESVLAALGARQTVPLGRSGALLVRLAGPHAADTIAGHGANPALAYIEPNSRYEAQLVPNEPWFSQQWSLLNTGQTGGTPGADIHATAAWDLGTGLPSAVIAILDSGIDLTHPDLAGNLYVNTGEIPDNGLDDDGNGFIDDVHGWDFVNEDNDPQDDNGHGTYMAGIAGAVANNGIGIAGVAWRVSLMPLKFLDDRGGGSTANAILALDYAVTMGAQITNNSWGSGSFSQALYDEITAASQAGVAFVASAGGSGRDLDVTPVYPVCYDVPNVVAVAATDQNDLLSVLSDYGEETVDLAAPGVAILTTQPGGAYGTITGVSTAAAHVSGALALVLSRFPGCTGLDAANHLIAHTEDVPSLDGLVRKGRLDVYAALAEVPSAVPGEDDAAVGRGPLLWWKGPHGEGVRLGLDWPRTGPATLAVYDVRGRRVREVFAGVLPAGAGELTWDGRAADGRRAASGIYFARLRGGGAAATVRVVIAR